MSTQTFTVLGDTVSNGTIKNAENLGYRRDVIPSAPELVCGNDGVKGLTSFWTHMKPIGNETLPSSTVSRRASPQLQRLMNLVTIRLPLLDELDI